MSKKLIIILVLIVAGMFGLALTTKSKTTEQPVATAKFSTLSDMIGKPAPDFSLKDQKGQEFKLSALRGKKIVLFFNEGIMCYPACWNQMAALGSDQQLNSTSVVAASIVTDSLSEWGSAFTKMPELTKGTILFDSDSSVSRTYGMLSLESSMHKGMKPGHTFVIIDPQGIIRYTKDDPQMGIRNNELDTQIKRV